MANQKQKSTVSKPVKLVHVQVLEGGEAEVFEIGESLKMWTESVKDKLPYTLHAIITNEKVVLQDVDTLIQSLLNLKKQIKVEEKVNLR